MLLFSLTEKLSFFISFVLLARALDINDYGFLVTIFVFSNILYSIFDLGFQYYFQRSAAFGSHKINDELNQVFSLKAILYLLYLLIVFLYFPIDASNNHLIVLFISLSIYLFGFSTLSNSIFLGKKLYKISFINVFISRLVMLTSLGGFIYFEMDLSIICSSFLLGAALHTFLNLYQLRKNEFQINFAKIKLKNIFNVLKSSTAIGTGIFFVVIYDRIDVLLLEKYLDFSTVAYYTVAYSLYKLPQMLSGTILVPAFTNFSSHYSKSGLISKQLIMHTILALFMIGIIFCFVYFAIGEFLITVIYGDSFEESSFILLMLIAAIPAIILNNFTGVMLNSIKKEQFPLISTFFGMIINIFICIQLIPSIGVKGAVISTIVTEYFVFLFQFISILKINKSYKFIN